MAPQKKAKSTLWKTALYYRNNPKARAKKKVTDTAINKRAEQLAKRSDLGSRRTKLIKKKGKAHVKGKDLSHTKNGIVLKKSSTNRGSKSDSAWDKRARGGKK